MARSFIAELVVSHPDLPLMPTVDRLSDAGLEVESRPMAAPEGASPIIFVSVTSSDFEEVEAALAADHTVARWECSLEFDACRTYQIYLTPEPKLTLSEIADLGVRVLSIENAERGWRLRLQAPDKERLGAYWRYCREEGVEFHLEKVYQAGPRATPTVGGRLTAGLTERQREVARAAAEMGYYEPDGASAEAVAAELGISPSTLSTHLRRIAAKLFRQLFES